MDQGINNPQEALQATGTAMFNGAVFTSTMYGAGASLKGVIGATNLLSKGYFATDAALTLMGLYNKTIGVQNELIDNSNNLLSTLSTVKSIKSNNIPLLHDMIGTMNSLKPKEARK